MTKRLPQLLLKIGQVLVALCFIGVIIAGPGHRWANLDFRLALKIFRWASITAMVATPLLLLSAMLFILRKDRRQFTVVCLALVISLPISISAIRMQRRAKEVPMIHDISTDLVNPPNFVAILPLRANAPNPATYGGPSVAEAQKLNYEYIYPIELGETKEAVFEKSVEIAKSLGWEIVDTDLPSGRIEATDTSFWFGFKDDVVLRIQTNAKGGTTLDMRSVSREGKSDLGVNAKRIRKFIMRLIPQ